jgi:hypothetical protein
MSLWYEPKITTIAAYSRNLADAQEAIQSAKNSGDEQALGYAEGQALRWRRAIAKLDPRGYGAQHLGTLTPGEREVALA